MTIEAILIDVLRRWVEISSAIPNSYPLLLVALLPDVNVIMCHVTIEGDDREGSEASQGVKLGKEGLQHLIRYRTRLVNRDSDTGLPSGLTPWVDIGEPPVEATLR